MEILWNGYVRIGALDYFFKRTKPTCCIVQKFSHIFFDLHNDCIDCAWISAIFTILHAGKLYHYITLHFEEAKILMTNTIYLVQLYNYSWHVEAIESQNVS